MKVYEIVIMDFAGNIIYEKSYEYSGFVDRCKGGEYAAKREADRAYKLQKQQLELQQRQIEELEAKEKASKYNEQMLLEEKLKRRSGRKAMMLTDLSDFNFNVNRKSLYAQ